MTNLFKSANLLNIIFSIVSITMCFFLFLFLKSNGFVAADVFDMQGCPDIVYSRDLMNAGFFLEYSRYSIQLEDVIHDCKWSKERFDAELEKGYNDMLNGRVTPWNDIYAKLSKAISEIKNGAPAADAKKFIKGLMNS